MLYYGLLSYFFTYISYLESDFLLRLIYDWKTEVVTLLVDDDDDDCVQSESDSNCSESLRHSIIFI